MERFWFTLEKLLPSFNNSIGATIACYNFKRGIPYPSDRRGRQVSDYSIVLMATKTTVSFKNIASPVLTCDKHGD